MRIRSLLTTAALLLGALGCHDETETPTGPTTAMSPATAAAIALSFRQVSTGSWHTCGVTQDDRAFCWGYNYLGQLGDGTRWERTTPTAVLGGLRFRTISAGATVTCGLTTDGRAYCWGAGGTLGSGSTALETCDDSPCSTRPLPVAGGFTFRQVTAGGYHACGITPENQAYCWGANWSGQLGDETLVGRPTPVRVLGSREYRQLSAGGGHTCGLTTTNRAFCWGSSRYGQLGDSTQASRRTRAVRVAGGYSFRQLAAGGNHTCGVTSANQALCWGDGREGQLGNGKTYLSFWPRRVLGGYAFDRVTAGGEHTCAETSLSQALCWGNSRYGRLGTGTRGRQLTPAPVRGGLFFSQVVAGGFHTCGRTSSGVAYCWGGNSAGQLGDGTQANHGRPTRVAPAYAPSTTTITGTTPAPGGSRPADVAVSFTVTAPSGTPTGTVTVTAYYSGTSCQADVTAGSCTLTVTSYGPALLIAAYGGDGTYAQSRDTLTY